MKIAVYVDSLQNGFNQPGSGEMRYPLNIAELFAIKGYEVYCFGAGRHIREPPQWGDQKPIPGIKFCQLSDISNIEFDILFNCPLDYSTVSGRRITCTNLPVKAKKKFIFLFSYSDNGEANLISTYFNGKVPEEFRIGVPYDTSNKCTTNKVPVKWITFPLFNQVSPLNLDQRNEITWACKDVFSDAWSTDMSIHSEGMKVLQCVKRFCDEKDMTFNFITSASLGQRAKRLGAMDIISSIKKKNLYPGRISFDLLKQRFDHSRFTVILPGYSGGFFDSIASGCKAVFYNNTGEFAEIGKSSFRLDQGIPLEDMYSKLELLFNNDQYISLITEQRTNLSKYNYDNSFNNIMEALKE